MKQFIKNGIYSIHHSKDENYSFTIKESSQEKETEIILDKFENRETQLFYFLFDDSDETYSIISLFSAKSIGVLYRKCEAGFPIIQNTISFQTNYKWKLIQIENAEDEYQLQLVSNDLKIGIRKDLDDIEKEENTFKQKTLTVELNDNFVINLKIKQQEIPNDEYLPLYQHIPKIKEVYDVEEYTIPDDIKIIKKDICHYLQI